MYSDCGGPFNPESSELKPLLFSDPPSVSLKPLSRGSCFWEPIRIRFMLMSVSTRDPKTGHSCRASQQESSSQITFLLYGKVTGIEPRSSALAKYLHTLDWVISQYIHCYNTMARISNIRIIWCLKSFHSFIILVDCALCVNGLKMFCFLFFRIIRDHGLINLRKFQSKHFFFFFKHKTNLTELPWWL